MSGSNVGGFAFAFALCAPVPWPRLKTQSSRTQRLTVSKFPRVDIACDKRQAVAKLLHVACHDVDLELDYPRRLHASDLSVELHKALNQHHKLRHTYAERESARARKREGEEEQAKRAGR